MQPTLSLGINFNSLPYFKKTFPFKENLRNLMIRVVIPAVCCALIPIPLVVITALVNGFSLNYRGIKPLKIESITSSATNFMQDENGASSGTLILYFI